MWLLLAFLTVPLVEIALFIQIGSAVGLWPTLAVVVLTAFVGTWLVRTQGAMAMGQLRASFSRLDDPTEPLANGAMILIAGVLLLTPGFFTDAVGLALLMPPVRRGVFSYLRTRVHVERFDMGPGGPRTRPGQRPDIIEGEYYVDDHEDRSAPRPSGWSRH